MNTKGNNIKTLRSIQDGKIEKFIYNYDQKAFIVCLKDCLTQYETCKKENLNTPTKKMIDKVGEEIYETTQCLVFDDIIKMPAFNSVEYFSNQNLLGHQQNMIVCD